MLRQKPFVALIVVVVILNVAAAVTWVIGRQPGTPARPATSISTQVWMFGELPASPRILRSRALFL